MYSDIKKCEYVIYLYDHNMNINKIIDIIPSHAESLERWDRFFNQSVGVSLVKNYKHVK